MFPSIWSRFGTRAGQVAPVQCDDSPSAPPLAEASGAPPAPREEPALQFEMFSREWQQLSQQDNFDGFRIEAGTQVTKYMQAAHTLFLGTQLRECGYIYQFGPTFQAEGGRTMMVARVGLDGGVNGRLIQKFGSSGEFKASSQSHLKDPNRNMYDSSVDYAGKNWAATTKLAWQGAWLMGGSFTQRLLQPLQVGGDLTFVKVQSIMTIGQVGLRYAKDKDVFTAAATSQPDPRTGQSVIESRFAYTRKVSERISLGTEFKYSHPDKESGLSMAYEYAFRNARVQGLLDSDGKVSCCVQDYQGLGMSGMIDYMRGDYKFGVLMHVMPPEGQA
jgi:mitochondrial import receptor subunit TOM40